LSHASRSNRHGVEHGAAAEGSSPGADGVCFQYGTLSDVRNGLLVAIPLTEPDLATATWAGFARLPPPGHPRGALRGDAEGGVRARPNTPKLHNLRRRAKNNVGSWRNKALGVCGALQQYWWMRAGVFRLAMSHPGDVSAVQQPILTGTVRAREIAAVTGKTEGSGDVADITSGRFTQSLTGRLSRYLGEPAHTPATLVCVLPDGCMRGHRLTMPDDTDIEAQRHIRGAVGGLAAGALGDTRIIVSGGAEHQGPDGGGPIDVFAERPVTSRSTSCAS
jgi:hypothetical protein